MKKFGLYFAIGAAILIVGLVLQWYPNSIIDGLEERLNDQTLPQDERNKLQGALNSWKIHSITTFQPLSSILFAVGIIIIIYSVISATFSIASSYRIVKAKEK